MTAKLETKRTSMRGTLRLRQTARMSARWYLRQTRRPVDPAGPVAARIALERSAGQRGRRLAATARDAARQRVRPTRPRMRAVVLSPGGKLAFRAVPAPPPPG